MGSDLIWRDGDLVVVIGREREDTMGSFDVVQGCLVFASNWPGDDIIITQFKMAWIL